MSFTWSEGEQLHVCPKPECPQPQYPARELLFLCPNLMCRGRKSDHLPGKPEQWSERTLFRPERFAHSAPCPFSPDEASTQVCPYCWSEQPYAGAEAETIAVVGSSISGKTCFVTGLIYQIKEHLAGVTAQRMSLEWRDEKGKRYFLAQERDIFRNGRLPRGTQKKAEVETMHVTLRFPVQGWRRLVKGPLGVVSLIVPDPAGEYFEDLKNPYTLRYLARARAILLMVDPWMSDRYRATRQALGRPLPDIAGQAADIALNALIVAVRKAMDQEYGLLNKELAVVLTKCDEEGLFDPDDATYKIPRQGRTYSARIAQEISRRVERHLQQDLGMNNVVAMAHNNFRRVCFFAASALGTTPIATDQDEAVGTRVVNPRPRHVEDPLLWIFHEWGYW